MDVPTLTKKHDFKLPTGILAAALAPDGKSLVAGCMDGVYRCDVDSGNEVRLYAHDSYVSSVAWLDDDVILSAGYDGRVRWFDLNAKQLIRDVKLHDFWSWDMEVSPDQQLLASVTGQYLAGGYKYEPLSESEPSLKVVSVATGQTLQSLPHVPSVQSVAISPDNQFVAAGNLMGEVRVFAIADGKLISSFTTPAFTSWGIIKSHSFLGGVFSMAFTPGGQELLLCGMGPMRDPMAGNGKQLWQKWSWQDEPKKVDETHQDEAGEGLMETLAIDPSGAQFVMGGRLRGGQWNVALFDLSSGKRIAMLKTGYRVTEARYTSDGSQLLLVGAQGQPKEKQEGKFPRFGRVELYDLVPRK